MNFFERHLSWLLDNSRTVDVSVRGRFYAMKGEGVLFASGPLAEVRDRCAVPMRPEWDGPGRVVLNFPPDGYGVRLTFLVCAVVGFVGLGVLDLGRRALSVRAGEPLSGHRQPTFAPVTQMGEDCKVASSRRATAKPAMIPCCVSSRHGQGQVGRPVQAATDASSPRLTEGGNGGRATRGNGGQSLEGDACRNGMVLGRSQDRGWTNGVLCLRDVLCCGRKPNSSVRDGVGEVGRERPTRSTSPAVANACSLERDTVTDYAPPRYTPPKAPEWATFVEDRSPQFKVHAGRGHAINAVYISMSGRGARGGTIYQLVDSEWQEWEVVPEGARRERV